MALMLCIVGKVSTSITVSSTGMKRAAPDATSEKTANNLRYILWDVCNIYKIVSV